MSRRRLFIFVALPAVAVACLLAACGVRGAGRWAMDVMVANEFDDVRAQTPDEIAGRLEGEAPPLLLDVRKPEEFAVSRIPGAVNLDPDADPAAALAELSRARPVIVYCSVGWRSAEMARRMAAAGFRDVTNMEGSIFQWVADGRPLVDAEGKPTERVHAFGPPWNWLVSPDHRATP